MQNVTDLSVNFDADQFAATSDVMIVNIYEQGKWIGKEATWVRRQSDRSYAFRIRIDNDKIDLVSPIEKPSGQVVKKHGLQGPIDDAFMSPFIFVKPTTSGSHSEIDSWCNSEMNRAIREWHKQMRGDVTVKTSEN